MISSNETRKHARALLKAVLVSAAILASWPAQTGQGETAISAARMSGAPEIRRVAADVCLTDVKILESLMDLGFDGVSLGANAGSHDMEAVAQFGDQAYTLILNRCTGRLVGAREVVAQAHF
jgi:hypothetical protein